MILLKLEVIEYLQLADSSVKKINNNNLLSNPDACDFISITDVMSAEQTSFSLQFDRNIKNPELRGRKSCNIRIRLLSD